jgi:ribosomal protein L11 methyltransferase
MHQLQITIPVADASLQEILIALLTELGYEGFEQQDSALQAFLPEALFDANQLETVLREFALSYIRIRVEKKNWNEEWEKSFEPVRLGDFCAVRAHFHAPIPGVAHELIVTPKMSFGTGHHATTYLMLQAMQNLDFRGACVLDFGTGTGVLAILAERLGAGEVLAIDQDSWSIDNARENIDANQCIRISLLQCDTPPSAGLFDIILANINKHVIVQYLPVLGQQLTTGGVILLSGLLKEDFEEIEYEAVKNNLSITERETKDSWICLKAEK